MDNQSFSRYQASMVEQMGSGATLVVQPADLFHRNAAVWEQREAEVVGEDKVAMLIFDAREIYDTLCEMMAEGREGDLPAELLFRWQYDIPEIYKRVHIVIVGGKSLDHQLQSQVNRDFRAAVMSGQRLPAGSRPTHSWTQWEQALWIAGLKFAFAFHHLDKAERLPKFLQDFASQLIKRSSSAAAAASPSEAGGICLHKAKRCASTLQSTWQSLLETISRVTPPIAEAIVAQFPTASSLLTHYASLPPEPAELALADLTANGRRVGPALSRRIHLVLASSEGNAMVNDI